MLNISQTLETSINHLAREKGQSVDDFLFSLVMEYQNEMEALYRAEQELDSIALGMSKTRPLSEVMKDYGMED